MQEEAHKCLWKRTLTQTTNAETIWQSLPAPILLGYLFLSEHVFIPAWVLAFGATALLYFMILSD